MDALGNFEGISKAYIYQFTGKLTNTVQQETFKEETFANFNYLRKFSLRNLEGVTLIGGTSEHFASFFRKSLTFHQFTKVFSTLHTCSAHQIPAQ